MNENLSRYLTREDATIVDAMQRLDRNAGGVLYVIDAESKLIGSLSDGDIRRWIIKSGDIEASVSSAMRRAVRYIREDEKPRAYEFMRKNSIVSVPIVDADGTVVEVIVESRSKRTRGMREKALSDTPVVVMAGGKGTRLYPYTRILPKPLIPVDGIPILERIFDRFYEYGVGEFYLSVNYRKEMIKSYFADLNPGYSIRYIDEKTPLGTAGSLNMVKDYIKAPFIVTNCDILINEEYDKILSRHRESGNCMTIVSSLKNTQLPYGVLHVKEDGIITEIEEKPTFSHLINTGMYVMEPEALQYIPEGEIFHMTDLIGELMKNKQPVGMYPISENAFLDMGEFEEFSRMEEMLKNGLRHEGNRL